MHTVTPEPEARTAGDGPDPIDLHVGQRLKARRVMLGISQEKLGDSLGLTFQQIQKYERGANRISASRLYHLSKVLDAPVSFFFEDMPEADYSTATGQSGLLHDAQASTLYESDPLKRDETMRLVCAYYRHQDADTRRRFVELMESTSRTSYARKGGGGED